MINLESSEEAIKGLAKKIAKDPTFPERLRKDQKDLLQENAIKDDGEYLESQEKILREAEEIGLSQTGYIFEISGETPEERGGYMIYKKITDEMTPIKEEFKQDYRATINRIEKIIEHSKENNINNLVTLHPRDQSVFYSHPWDNFDEVDRGEEKEDSHGHYASHEAAIFTEKEIEKLKENGIAFYEMDEKTAYGFTKGLKIIE